MAEYFNLLRSGMTRLFCKQEKTASCVCSSINLQELIFFLCFDFLLPLFVAPLPALLKKTLDFVSLLHTSGKLDQPILVASVANKNVVFASYCPLALPVIGLFSLCTLCSKLHTTLILVACLNRISFSSFIQFTSYPGFFPHEVTPLPGQLEAPQLLNRVTKAQQFPVSCIIYFMETQGLHSDL